MEDRGLILEKSVEMYLKKRINDLGGICWKFTSPGTVGVPDRLVLLNGKTAFVELKRPKGGRLSAVQTHRIFQIRNAGGNVAVLTNKNEVDRFVEDFTS